MKEFTISIETIGVEEVQGYDEFALVVELNNRVVLNKSFTNSVEYPRWGTGGIRIPFSLSIEDRLDFFDEVFEAIEESGVFPNNAWEDGILYQRHHLVVDKIARDNNFPKDKLILLSNIVAITGHIKSETIRDILPLLEEEEAIDPTNSGYYIHRLDEYDVIPEHGENFIVQHPLDQITDFLPKSILLNYSKYVTINRFTHRDDILFVSIDIPLSLYD